MVLVEQMDMAVVDAWRNEVRKFRFPDLSIVFCVDSQRHENTFSIYAGVENVLASTGRGLSWLFRPFVDAIDRCLNVE